jgi:ACT domain-containing protein
VKRAGEVLDENDIVDMIHMAANEHAPLQTVVIVTDNEMRGRGVVIVDDAPLEGWPVIIERLVGQVPMNALLWMAVVVHGTVYDDIERIDITPWQPQVDPGSF